jgi:hypothetical protein
MNRSMGQQCLQVLVRRTRRAALALAFAALASAASAQVLYVSHAGDGTTGSSWATAYQTIGAALAAAEGPTQIWIAEGVYPERLQISLDGIELRGGFAGDELALEERHGGETAIDAQLSGRPLYLFYVSDVVIDRMTLQNGSAYGSGGAVYMSGCENVLISDSTIRDCTSQTGNGGGGVYASSGSLTVTDVTIERCIAADKGGGLRSVGCDSNLLRVRFIENEALAGGGLALEGGIGQVSQCLFLRNSATSAGLEGGGGAWLCVLRETPVIRNHFRENTATYGAALDCLDRTTTDFYNNLFSLNTAGTATILIRDPGTGPRFVNNTVADNTSLVGNSAIYVANAANATFRNENICFNQGPEAAIGRDATSAYDWALSNFYDNAVGPFTDPADLVDAGSATTELDPRFISRTFLEDPWSYQIDPDSPVRDYGYPMVTEDFAGGERPVNSTGKPVAYPDRGCFEYQAVAQYVHMPLWAGPKGDGDQSTALLHVVATDEQGQTVADEWIPQSADGFYLIRGDAFAEGSGPFDVQISAAGYLRRAVQVPSLPACFSTGVDVTLAPGDGTGDNRVDVLDLNAVLIGFGQAGELVGDVNGDLFVDLEDLNAVLTYFGTQGDG